MDELCYLFERVSVNGEGVEDFIRLINQFDNTSKRKLTNHLISYCLKDFLSILDSEAKIHVQIVESSPTFRMIRFIPINAKAKLILKGLEKKTDRLLKDELIGSYELILM